MNKLVDGRTHVDDQVREVEAGLLLLVAHEKENVDESLKSHELIARWRGEARTWMIGMGTVT